ncbi:hypothetical protein RVX78_004591 [Enterobacter cloacae]|nr:hypothetical protein [Enterobacter cloacae]
MRKYKILLSGMISLAVILAAAVGFMLYKNPRNDVLIQKCEADVRYDVYEEGELHTLDALYVLAVGPRNQGFLHITGVLNSKGKKKDIDRTYSFTFKENGKVGLYGIQIFKEKVSSYDGVDSNIFHDYFLPDKPGEELYIKASSPDGGLYLFQGFSYSFFMCTVGA